MAITTVSSCKAFKPGVDGGADTSHDAELERIIQAVQAWLEGACERTFEQGTVTEYFSGESFRDRIIVSRPPIVSITNLWDDLLRVYSTPISNSLYVIEDARAGVVRLDGLTFQRGINNIKVTYSGGFAVIPEDIEQAAIEMVWAAREKGVNNLVGVRSRSLGDGSVQYLSLEWDTIAKAIVARYSLHTGVS